MASIKGIELIRQRLIEIKGAPRVAAQRAAPRIEAKLRADATTKRGNVPSFGRMGDVPISTEVRNESVVVHGPDWVLKKAQVEGQVDQWVDIVHDETAKALKAGSG
jgi:hypothetical protein